MKKTGCIDSVIAYHVSTVHSRVAFLVTGFLLFLILCVLPEYKLMAQDSFIDDKNDPPFAYDEIPVNVTVEGVGNFYLDVIYTSKDQLYINVEDLFTTLNIPCIVSKKRDSISGFIDIESRTYLIDYDAKQVKVGDQTFAPENRIIKEMNSLYLESSMFAEAFGITLSFNYRAMSIQ